MLGFSNIAGRYKVSRLVHTRGVASSYLAVDTRDSDRQVLLEVAPVGEQSTARQEYLDRLSELADDLRSLEHANLVPVRDFFVDGPYYGFVKVFHGGELLEDWLLDSADGVSLDLRISLCRDVLEGLAALHGSDVLHRDLSSRSVWLASQEGSRPVAQVDHFYRAVRSSGDYVDPERRLFSGRVAPEVSAGATYSQRSDVFAAGLLLLEILDTSPQEPDWDDNIETVKELSEDEVRKRVPAPYAEVVARATRASRLERFQDGLDLLAAFDAMDLGRRMTGAGEL